VKLTQLRELWPGGPASGQAAAHGTAVASVLLGRHDGPVPGMAPLCRAISVPVFTDGRRTSQLDLARAIELAADAGAHVINVSGGQLAEAGEAEDALARVIRRCRESNVLVVAAAGNDGCLCDHVPAALDGVLAVGACDEHGQPLAISNFGPGSRRQGLLAPGENVLVAVPGGGSGRMSGTSLAAPVVAGAAALLLSLQLRQGRRLDPLAAGRLLLATTDPCPLPDAAGQAGQACAPYLNGTLNLTKAMTAMTTSTSPSPSVATTTPSAGPAGEGAPALAGMGAAPAGVVAACGAGPEPVGCGCGTDPAPAPGVLVSAAQTVPAPAPASTAVPGLGWRLGRRRARLGRAGQGRSQTAGVRARHARLRLRHRGAA
jgi:subtilisin family serine protease